MEIVTLSRTDFQEEVTYSSDFWFINFYSTFCSHCHALAPTVNYKILIVLFYKTF